MRFILPDKIVSYLGKFSPVDRRVFLICIGLSTFFWFLKKMSNSYRVTWPVEVHIEHPPEIDMETPLPKDITVEVKGHGWDLIGNSKVIATFEQSKPGTLAITKYLLLKAIEQRIPSSKVTVGKLSTDGFTVVFDSLVQKRVPIIIDYHLELPEQFHLRSSPTIQPDSALLTGPKSLLDTIQMVKTEPIVFLDIKESKTVKVHALQPNPQVVVKPSVFEVTIPIESETEKTLYVPLQVLNAPVDSLSSDSLVVFPARVNIAFMVGLGDYNNVTATDFEVVVDLSGVKKETNSTSAPILVKKSPAFVEHVKLSPNSARFFYVKRDTL